MQLLLTIFGVLLAVSSPVLSQAGSSCYTPIGDPGACVPPKQCQFVRDLIATYGINLPRSLQNQIMQMRCNGGPGFHMCCPNPSVISEHGEARQDPPKKARTKSTPSQQVSNRIDSSGMELLKSMTNCGKKSNVRVAHGLKTQIGEFPWLVLIKYDVTGRPFRCGGSLITDRFVLTAAHCFVDDSKAIAVRLGEYNLDTEQDCQFLGGRKNVCLPPYEDIDIEDTRVHPQYNGRSIDFDIALVKMVRPVAFKTHINSICLPIYPESQDLPYDQSFYIAGWGRTEKNVASPVLLKAIVTLKNNDVCRNYYVDAVLDEKHFCAASDEYFQTCRGDSGGPVFFQNPFKHTLRHIQYGIVSHGGFRCGVNRKEPGVFTSVINMLPWITQNLY